jgi:hypothetical protein
MKKVQTRRLNTVATALAACPLRDAVVQRAFEYFRKTGELPEQQRIADAVCRRALGGDYEKSPIGDPTANNIESFIHITIHRHEPKDEGPPTVRENVFDEAVFCDGIIQRGARVFLTREVRRGADPADPQFLADNEFPDHPGVGLHLLGYTEWLAKPPYVAQARRLFARYDEIRVRINRFEDDPWFETCTDAILRFLDTGDLPDDELLRDTVLADAEFAALQEHATGRDVREWMAVLDKAARAKGPKREQAIAAVQAFVRSGLASPE